MIKVHGILHIDIMVVGIVVHFMFVQKVTKVISYLQIRTNKYYLNLP